MLAILGELKEGSAELGPLYKQCLDLWAEVLDDAHDITVDELAERLDHLQDRIELTCNMDRYLGKDIMAVSGYSFLYDSVRGFEENEQLARRLREAFKRSMVSGEVKSWAEDAARLFFAED